MSTRPALAPPRGYSNGVAYGAGRSVLFLSGQIGWDAAGRLVSDRFDAQFDQALANLVAIVAAAGGTPESISKLTIYVLDCADAAPRARRSATTTRRQHGPSLSGDDARRGSRPPRGGRARRDRGIAWL